MCVGCIYRAFILCMCPAEHNCLLYLLNAVTTKLSWCYFLMETRKLSLLLMTNFQILKALPPMMMQTATKGRIHWLTSQRNLPRTCFQQMDGSPLATRLNPTIAHFCMPTDFFGLALPSPSFLGLIHSYPVHRYIPHATHDMNL